MESLYPFLGLVSIVLGGFMAVWGHRKSTRINLDADAERAKLSEQTSPLQAIVDGMRSKDALMERLLTQSTEQATANTRLLGDLCRVSEGIAKNLEAYRADGIRRAEKLYVWMNNQDHKMSLILDRTERNGNGNGKSHGQAHGQESSE